MNKLKYSGILKMNVCIHGKAKKKEKEKEGQNRK